MTPWFDTHAHVDQYDGAERAAMLERARAADVEVIAVSVDLQSSRRVVAMQEIRARAVGVHPRFAAEGFETELRQLAVQPGEVAIGECGFDAEGPDAATQTQAFLVQCRLARELGKALILHIDGEGSWERFMENASALEGLRVIRHYFTGDESQSRWHADRGHYLSFGNPLRRDSRLREIAHGFPADRILIETDSYPLPGRNTEPANVAKVGETLALVRGWTFEEAKVRLAANTQTAFKLPPLTADS